MMQYRSVHPGFINGASKTCNNWIKQGKQCEEALPWLSSSVSSFEVVEFSS